MAVMRIDNKANWEVAKFQDIPDELSGYDFVVGQMLLQRGITTLAAAERFLRPSLDDLGDPSQFADMDKAVARIKKAVEEKEVIVVYGDYDVDGVTSSTVLISALKELGAAAQVYLPERLKEGYGLNNPALQKLKDEGTDLVITVDNGTASVDQVAFANSIGLEVVIIDHHEPHGHLPDAHALVNPKRPDNTYPFRECAAVGVVYHVVRKLLGEVAARKYLDLVAVGTVADVVPLLEDNRVFAVEGLKILNETKRPGLQALIEVAGLKGTVLDVYHIGFQLGPRINAAGRIDHARLAFDLLNAKDFSAALKSAKELNDLNSRRQEMTDVMLIQAKAEQAKFANEKIILVGAEGWSIGVAGIVAGRLVEAYSKPAIVFEYQEEYAKGSGRSVDDVHIVELLNLVAEDMDHYGGHAKAAGLSVKRDKFDEFKLRLEHVARENIDELALRAKIKINVQLEAAHVNSQLLEEVERFAPFGFGNPTPVFAVRNLKFVRCEPIGPMGRFGKIIFVDDAGALIEVMCFDKWEELLFDLEQDNRYDVAFTISSREWNGRKYMQCKMVAIREASFTKA